MVSRRRAASAGAVALVAASIALVGGVSTAAPVPADWATRELRLASVDDSGVPGNGRSVAPALSADGRFVAFLSEARNLVTGDANALMDAFVKDRLTGAVERVSVGYGPESNGSAGPLSISADGRFVAFSSDASNLVRNDRNGVRDIFVRDRAAHTTIRLSESGGVEADEPSDYPAISANGAFVAFQSRAANLVIGDLNQTWDVFARPANGAGRPERMSVSGAGAEGDDASDRPRLSGDGRFVAFRSTANNLVPNDNNGANDVFVRDRKGAGTTERVSVDGVGRQANRSSGQAAISADGRFVAFSSNADNLVPADTNHSTDVFVHDRFAAPAPSSTVRASVDGSGAELYRGGDEPAISADGRLVAFYSESISTAGAIHVRDLAAGTTSMVNVRGDGQIDSHQSSRPAMSADGRTVVFLSSSPSLAMLSGQTQVYVKGPQVGFDPNCDLGDASIVCDLTFGNPVGPVTIRWSVDGAAVGWADDLALVTFPCEANHTVTIWAVISDRNGQAFEKRSLTCLSDS